MSPAARHALADRSFERLYRRHRRDVYGFALRAVRDPDEAEDVTQVAFLNAYRALHRGDEPEKPRAWLLTIANNVARRRFRDRALRPQEVELDAELPASGSEWNALVAREIRAALGRLRPNRRAVVVLRDIEGLSYAEIADRLNLSESAVESLLFRARKDLQNELVDLGRTPVVHRRRLRGLLTLPLPASLVNSLDSLVAGFSRTPVAVRAAGALAALVLGAGVATQGESIVSAAIDDGKRPTLAVSALDAPSALDERLHIASTATPAPQPEAAQTTKAKTTKAGTSSATGDDDAKAASETESGSSGTPVTDTVSAVEPPVESPVPAPAPAAPDAEETVGPVQATVDDVASTLPLPPPPPLPLP